MQLLEAKQLIRELMQEIQDLRAGLDIMKGFTLQQSLDVACVSLNEEFSFGPVYNARFEKRFRKKFDDYALLSIDDAKDDEEMVYTKTKLDDALRIACGDDILPFDDRYAIENLWFRTKLEEGAKDGQQNH